MKLIGNKDSVSAYALLDEGSTVTIIDLNTARKINSKVSYINIHLTGIGDHETSILANEKISLQVKTETGTHFLDHVIVIDNISYPFKFCQMLSQIIAFK